MKRIFPMLMILCMFFAMVFPMTAYATDADTALGISDSEAAPLDEDAPEETPSGIADETPEEVPADIAEETPEETPQISLFSDFTDGDNEFYTRIRLTVTDRQGNPLSGVVFGVYETATDVKVAELTTGTDGTAISGELPTGAYYLLERTAPSGYKLNTDKNGVTVKSGEAVEITITNEKTTTTSTTDPDPTDGRIKLTKTDSESGKLLSGAVFGVYKASNDVKVCELTTGGDGTATSPLLPKGEYYLKEITAPAWYELSTEKTGVTVKADKTVEITVTNEKTSTSTTDPDPTDGWIKLIKTDSETGKKLSGAVFGVYKASSGVKVCELTTGGGGTATSPLLPKGEYYLKEITAPSGYELSGDKTGVTVKADKTVEITVINEKTPDTASTADPTPTTTPEPASTPTTTPESTSATTTTGKLLVIKKAAQTGNPLSGAVFGVYSAADNKKITELTTNTDGKAALALSPGEYYLKEIRAPYGYLLEPAKIYFTVTAGAAVTAEVTNIRDESIPDSDMPDGTITIPKTGGDFPAANYMLAVFLWGIAILCGILLYNGRKMKMS